MRASTRRSRSSHRRGHPRVTRTHAPVGTGTPRRTQRPGGCSRADLWHAPNHFPGRPSSRRPGRSTSYDVKPVTDRTEQTRAGARRRRHQRTPVTSALPASLDWCRKLVLRRLLPRWEWSASQTSERCVHYSWASVLAARRNRFDGRRCVPNVWGVTLSPSASQPSHARRIATGRPVLGRRCGSRPGRHRPDRDVGPAARAR